MTESYLLPLKVTIGNATNSTQAFQPYHENFNELVEAGNVVEFNVRTSSEALYYKNQTSSKVLVGISDSTIDMSAGTYNAGTETFTEGNTYSIVADNENSIVVGTIPYMENAPLGLGSGNIFTARIAKEGITSRDDLPSGKIVKITNTEVESGYNEYTKAAFEADGSLVLLVKVKQGSKLEAIVKWSNDSDFVTYTFDIQAAMQTL